MAAATGGEGSDRRHRSAVEVVEDALATAHARATLGAFWSLAEERARAQAVMLDAQLAGSSTPALAGVAVAVKDNFDLAGLPTTGGLAGAHPAARSDATAVRLVEQAGAIAIGKTAMDPLAWSTHGQAPGFPPCLNPLDSRLSPGGSSAGSAVAVAAGIVPLGLGTDTAGSVRIPAAFCGIVGLKPATGEISPAGCLPLAPSFDAVGVLGPSVRACAIAHEVLARAPLRAAEGESPAVGILTDLFEAADPAVFTVCEGMVRRLEQGGVQVEEARLDWWAPGFGLLLAVEFAASWGQRAAAEPERFPSEILSAIERAQTIAPARHDEVRAELMAARSALRRRLARFAAVLSPTVPVPVPTVEEEDVATSTRFTRIFSALGWPALSVPCGSDTAGRPVGMQIASARDLSAAVDVAMRVERLAQEGPA